MLSFDKDGTSDDITDVECGCNFLESKIIRGLVDQNKTNWVLLVSCSGLADLRYYIESVTHF